ncbi:DUF4396 domain-containing protein [Sphingomonas hankyongi]|uniref:DUF4396 domain-containing protein n=1 Tax=Sphingomonas hankyongi TaxID=2908209 RepID=UPI0024C1F171|nr:DUF4396 domain-containing protein [Sphingomonas hankyongi]
MADHYSGDGPVLFFGNHARARPHHARAESRIIAFRIIWIGEVTSIGVMEIVMNFIDYQLGGMGAPSIVHWSFWRGLLFAVPAGFLAAWPVNYWLIKRELKACH